MLHRAALLHDIGKAVIAERILFKREPLEPGEYEAIKEHAVAGAVIAATALSDNEEVAWIRHHHERPDGRGYPDGLRGDEIPEGAQLLALAEAWDAMTSPRHYGDTRPAAAALAECRRQAGAQFAPSAVEALERSGAPDELP